MNRSRASGLGLPKLRDSAREQAQHAAHALEVLERGGLGRERVENFWMERVAPAKAFDVLRVVGIRGKRVFVGQPERTVGFNDGHCFRAVDFSEQPAKQNLNGLV